MATTSLDDKSRVTRPVVFVLAFFAVCLAARIFELFVLRTDLSVIGEAFLHKLFGIGLLALALVRLRYTWSDIGFRRDKPVRGLLAGVLLGGGAFVVAYAADTLVQRGDAPHLRFYATSYGIAENTAMQSGVVFVLVCLAGNLINVVMEDGVFRGLFMRVLGTRHSFVISLLISSFIFGLWHCWLPLRNYFDGEQSGAGATMSALLLIVTSFIFGAELCLLCQWENALWTGMTVHFINNASVNLLHVVTAAGVDRLQTMRISIAQTLICIVALALVIVRHKRSQQEKTRNM